MDEQQKAGTVNEANIGSDLEQLQETDQPLRSEAPEAVRSAQLEHAVGQFNALEVDDKLAVLYGVYKLSGQAIDSATPDDANFEMTREFFGEFDALPQGEAQLEAMRALLRRDGNAIGHIYSRYTETERLAIWLLLAKRMGSDVIGVPAGYQLSEQAQTILALVQPLDFEQQITFLGDTVKDTDR
ncbi:gll0259 [Gloeobacter violaceus PCC 7421]|uniref:Gll0259 protein n=2 Tax=Gloeobacter violaceus TaxID=33072 RepID=Q7NNZ9_GLOVI|nr:gll0259 [Gloeobacter violaceus PCC 7421]